MPTLRISLTDEQRPFLSNLKIALATSTTVNIPPVTASIISPNALKTDLDLLSKKASPDNVQTSFNFMKPNTTIDTNKQSQAHIDASTIIMHKDHLYGVGITDDDKNDEANVKAAGEAQACAAQKRLLNDMDTTTFIAASKIGNETVKCLDESAGRDPSGLKAMHQIGGGGNSGGSDSCVDRFVEKRSSASPITSPTSSAATIDALSSATATTSTSMIYSHSNERRPSWRLKLDSGCKVCNIEPKTMHSNEFVCIYYTCIQFVIII